MYLNYRRTLIRILVPFALLTFLLFGLPNIFNQREQAAFGPAKKTARARQIFGALDHPDSISFAISEFYDRGTLAHIVLGAHHRDLWATQTKLPVYWGLDTVRFLKSGGGQQTTSLEVKDREGRHYTFRSIDKDNARILPNLLKHSFLRPFLRDQASAINPYATRVVNQLMGRLDILHPKSHMYIIPYSEREDSITKVFAGQTILLEEEIGKSWTRLPQFDYARKLVKTDIMLAELKKENVYLDTAMYIKCRLFDFMISDWDRHEKQWKWGIYDFGTGESRIVRPIPIDRDMALCMYGDGWASKLVRLVNNKFQSFDNSPIQVDGLTHNSLTLDKALLLNAPKELYLEQAKAIKTLLDERSIKEAFSQYPREIYQLKGQEHENNLKVRLERLEQAATDFYNLIQS